MRDADITFVILTKDEARNIADCLQSLPSGAPALVYDALSSDETASIAGSLGAEIVQAPWLGYVRARAAAAAMVSTPWTFMLDADERLSIALREELAALVPQESVTAFSVPRRNWFCGRWIRSAGWWPDRLVRMFRTGTAEVVAKSGESGADLHETWRTEGHCVGLNGPIEHFSYQSTSAYWRKFVRYTNLEAQTAASSSFDTLASWLAAPLRFGWLAVARGGLLDGWRGMVVCAGSALYPAVAAAKKWRRSHSTHA